MLKHIAFYSSLMGQTLKDDKPATQSHVLVYGAIEAHSMGEHGCIASNKTIGAETGLSVSRVASIISEIAWAGWIIVHMDKNNHRTLIEPNLTLAIHGNPPCHTRQGPLATHGNIEHSIENIKKTSAKANDDLFVNLVETLGFSTNRVRFTAGRDSKLRARMKSFSAENIQLAAKALAASPWHMGDNPNGVKYGTIDFLLRNDETVEKWMNHKINNRKSGGVLRV